MSTQATSFLESASAATLFELFDTPLSSIPALAEEQSTSSIEEVENVSDPSKPKQILGESVFTQFVKTQSFNEDFPLGFQKLDVPELSPSVGTVTPMELHSSVVESIFSPAFEDSTPLFEETELDSSNWKSLFEPGELEISEIPVISSEVKVEPVASAATTVIAAPVYNIVPYTSPVALAEELPTNFTTSNKRSSTDAGFESAVEVKRSNSTPVDHSDSFESPEFEARKQSRVAPPLTPIVVDNGDPIAAKRARNTEAARRSRARKMERMNVLEDKVEELTLKNNDLQSEVARLKAMLAAAGH